MGNYYKKELTDYSDDDLLSLIKNFKNLDKKRFADIIDELDKRGLSRQVNSIESDLIKQKPIYSKFWDRIGAFLIDGLILGVSGYILGILFGDLFVLMGNQSIIVGFIITLIYFGLGNSKIFNGQTPGKKILKLKVVGENSDAIKVSRSLIRTLIITVPYFFLNYKIAGCSESSVLYIAKSIFFLSFLITLIIHFSINTQTRQAIHDLILDTYVIDLEAYPRQVLSKSRSLPIIISGGFDIFLIALMIFINVRNNNSTSIMQNLRPINEQINNIHNIGYSSISRNTSLMKKFGSNGCMNKTNYLQIEVVLKEKIIPNLQSNDVAELDFVKEAINIILKNYQDVNKLDRIQVNLIYGYDIGISKSFRTIEFSDTPENWKERIK